MANWVLKGLRTGIKTTCYPTRYDRALGMSPGRPAPTCLTSADRATRLSDRCPTGALQSRGSAIAVDYGHCIHCLRCKDNASDAVEWADGYEWAAETGLTGVQEELNAAFGRSLHVRFVDAGACGACISEARQLNNPYYNMHRLGFFMTPTPRNADILLVAGPLTEAMRVPLRKTYDAMPEPKRVVAIGACAISGGVFGPSFISAGDIAELLLVDVTVPGCPPPPLAILHGLLTVVKRKPPAAKIGEPTTNPEAAR